MDICFIYTYGTNLDISHGGIKKAMDTNLLEVAGTVAACDHLDSIRTNILRLLFECHTIVALGFTQTTTKGDDYNYPKAKLQLSPRETHWQTLLRSLVYTTISFLSTLYM